MEWPWRRGVASAPGAYRGPLRRLARHVRALGHGVVSSWPWWPAKHRFRARRCVQEVGSDEVADGVADPWDPLRVSPGGRDIGVDSLTTELVIDRRLAHGDAP